LSYCSFTLHVQLFGNFVLSKSKLLLIGTIAVAFSALIYFDLVAYLDLDVLKSRFEDLREWYAQNPLSAGLIFFAVYVVVVALSIPGATVMTLAGGALFGFWYALFLISFASSIGATLAFLVSRILLKDWIQGKFGNQLSLVNKGFEKDGQFYLFTLRLVPIFPFFLVNLLTGLLPISTRTFYWVSQLGMLPATAVYVNAGTHLGQLESAAGIVSLPLALSFALLGVFPFLARGLLRRLQARRALAPYKRPKSFDNNIIVIGAGSGGLVAALIAATVKAKVTLIERHRMGGDCLNTGCVPSKSIIRSARIAQYIDRAAEFGLDTLPAKVDFPRVMERVQSVIKTIEPHDSVERFTELGVNCVQGDARIISPWEVEVNGAVTSARHIIVATGARPHVPDIPGLDTIDYLTSDTLWEIREQPRRLLVLGGGPIGCELAQAFASLGSEVTLVTRASRLLPREDIEVSESLFEEFRAVGITVLLKAQPLSFTSDEHGLSCAIENTDADPSTVEFDRVLLAVGRNPNIENLGLEELGVRLTEAGNVEVDEYLTTSVPTILACGDVAGPYLFTHMASHQAWYSAVNALFGRFRRFRVDYSVVPWATFTSPEVARVGLNELDAHALDIPYEVTRYELEHLDRAIADGEARGFVKVLTVPGRDRILGVTIVGYHAAELLNEFVLAMKQKIGLSKILGTIHIYPTLSEANKFAAGEWRKARKPEGLLTWVERYHSWVRGG
jgi:pyruvate/2-oxoglutarate dehydrogenase complex dihydrolipoamide dehydrogenase (E3) component/uncharacterized membrane protein YdjX (TVP38/TMEM64 family)